MKLQPRLFSYIVAWDAGLAPNPYFDFCTLAVCKPQIRKTAREGDWIVGLSPRRLGYHLVYAMRVDAAINFAEYYQDHLFSHKIPNMDSNDLRVLNGDNFYAPTDVGFIQLPSAHSHFDGTENENHKHKDLSGESVLISGNYYYFGESSPILPPEFSFLEVGRAHKNHFEAQEISKTIRFLEQFNQGIQGEPRDRERSLRWLRNKER